MTVSSTPPVNSNGSKGAANVPLQPRQPDNGDHTKITSNAVRTSGSPKEPSDTAQGATQGEGFNAAIPTDTATKVDDDESEEALKAGTTGDTGRYTFSKDQTKILWSRMPKYKAAAGGKRAIVAKEIYDEIKKHAIFAKPEGRSLENWKKSVCRWYENNGKKKLKEDDVGATSKPKKSGKGTSPAAAETKGTDGSPVKVKALTKLFNSLIGGAMIIKTGKMAFGEAHGELLRRTMYERNDEDSERVLGYLWDELSLEKKEHWENVATGQNPVLENQEGFASGLQALIRCCLQSKALGRAGVAVAFCFDKEEPDCNGNPKTESFIINEWWDATAAINNEEMLAVGEPVTARLHTNLIEAMKRNDLNSLVLKTDFPLDPEGNTRFPFVDTESLVASEARVMLHDWYRTHWVHSGHKGPVRYSDIEQSPDDFYSQTDLPWGMKILNPTAASKAMTSFDAVKLASHFAENFGITGHVFSFKAPRGISIVSEDPNDDPVAFQDDGRSGGVAADAGGPGGVDGVDGAGKGKGKERMKELTVNSKPEADSSDSDDSDGSDDDSDNDETHRQVGGSLGRFQDVATVPEKLDNLEDKLQNEEPAQTAYPDTKEMEVEEHQNLDRMETEREQTPEQALSPVITNTQQPADIVLASGSDDINSAPEEHVKPKKPKKSKVVRAEHSSKDTSTTTKRRTTRHQQQPPVRERRGAADTALAKVNAQYKLRRNWGGEGMPTGQPSGDGGDGDEDIGRKRKNRLAGGAQEQGQGGSKRTRRS
ncbi:hypothetical protein V5O48_017375 [Marasmius crinis-equi]|uniref:Uncharacterized protein n=1 Tax=Marasmius crinis-equi TaxID=585013 RepID=A0ABR3EP72_9AGAR